MSSSVDFIFLRNLGLGFAVLFLLLGALDGIYFHLIKYRLHRFRESRFEHQIHSVRGILLGVMGLLIFPTQALGDSALRAGALGLVIAGDLILEIVDIYVEKKSRASLGGISSSEMVLHVFASSFRMAALVLLIVSGTRLGYSPVISVPGMAVSGVAILIGVVGCYGMGPILRHQNTTGPS